MAEYIALKDFLKSDTCTLIKAGEKFTAEFPKGMKPCGNYELTEKDAKKQE